MSAPDYKFEEDKLLKEIATYIEPTYTQHYGGKYQATDMIIDAGHGEGFAIGSIMKYAKRYGKKEGKNRKDLLKIIHYGIIALHIHDLESEPEKPEQMNLFEDVGSGVKRFYVSKDSVGYATPTVTFTTVADWSDGTIANDLSEAIRMSKAGRLEQEIKE